MGHSEAMRRAYLSALGVTVWESRATAVRAAEPSGVYSLTVPLDVVAAETAAAGAVNTLDWDGLQKTVAACTLCGLRAGCKQTVFGVGNRRAQWMFVGEAPGADEDRRRA